MNSDKLNIEKFEKAITLFESGKYNEAKNFFIQLHNDGYLLATRVIGNYYFLGLGCEKNYDKAEKYYTITANEGDQESMYSLASIYFKKKEYEKSKNILLKLYEEDYLPSYYLLAMCYESDINLNQKHEPKALLYVASKRGHIKSLERVISDSSKNFYETKDVFLIPFRLIRLFFLSYYLHIFKREDERLLF